jgi:DNA repair protein RadC
METIMMNAMKPGRKFVESGTAACTDAEILAILIGSGGHNYSALDVANELLDKYGSLAAMMDKPLIELAEVRGIKAVRAVRIAAAFELTCRIIKSLEHGRK